MSSAFYRSLLSFSLIGLLCSCANSIESPDANNPLRRDILSDDGKLSLKLHIGSTAKHEELPEAMRRLGERQSTTSRYTLSSAMNGEVLGKAESAITKNDILEGRFQGKQTVQFSADGSRVLITEDVSDALPSIRYILFERRENNYVTSYLAPPSQTIPQLAPMYMLPDVSLAEDGGFEIRFGSEVKHLSEQEMPRFDTPFNRGH